MPLVISAQNGPPNVIVIISDDMNDSVEGMGGHSQALTPNIMARTIETVQGGGLIIFLLRTVTSLRQLYAMSMDVHSRYRTESSGDVVPRFNERFILSLGGCSNCLVCDDELNILPLSKKSLN